MQTPTPTGCPAKAAAPSEPIIVLRPVGKLTADYTPALDNPCIELRSDTYTLLLFRHYGPDPKSRANKNPTHWRGMKTRNASDGRKWSTLAGPFVCDDFGYLVPAGAAA